MGTRPGESVSGRSESARGIFLGEGINDQGGPRPGYPQQSVHLLHSPPLQGRILEYDGVRVMLGNGLRESVTVTGYGNELQILNLVLVGA